MLGSRWQEAQRELDELRRQGVIIDDELPGVTVIRMTDPDGEDPATEDLQSFLDQQTRDLDRAIQDSSSDSDDDEAGLDSRIGCFGVCDGSLCRG